VIPFAKKLVILADAVKPKLVALDHALPTARPQYPHDRGYAASREEAMADFKGAMGADQIESPARRGLRNGATAVWALGDGRRHCLVH
jgi:hypothetical protein